jgi:membrane-associated HD superfamily phosphohydrolase
MKAKPNRITVNIKKAMNMLFSSLRSIQNLFSIALCAIAVLVVIANGNNETVKDIDNFETGRVAERDVIASIPVTYVDKEATNLRGETVNRHIEKGQKIIRKGFIISETEMADLKELYSSFPKRDPRNIIGYVFLVLLIYVLYIILRGRIILGRELTNSEGLLLTSLTGSYIIGSVLLNNISPGFEGFPLALAIPTALFIMIIAVFLKTRTAMIMAIALPLGGYFAGAFDNYSYLIAIVSGAAACTVLRNAKSRMSLVKAGLVIAVANCFAVVVVLLIRQAGLYSYPAMLFWAALNGIISGMLILGFFFFF